MNRPRFTHAAFIDAHYEWGASCGPGAIAAVLDLNLEELRPRLFDFEQRRCTNPTLMKRVLGGLGVEFEVSRDPFGPPYVSPQDLAELLPSLGVAYVQFEGPWTAPGVPAVARYKRTHWIAIRGGMVFDINSPVVEYYTAWRLPEDWANETADRLVGEIPKATGWHISQTFRFFGRPVAKPAGAA